MKSDRFSILVIGSTCLDHFLFAGDISKGFNGTAVGGKNDLISSDLHPDGTLKRVGGSAPNTSIAIGPLASAFDLDAIVFKSMRLGRDHENPGKRMILESLGNPHFGDSTLIDPMHGTNYAVLTNTVIENGGSNRDRVIFKAPKSNIPLSLEAMDKISDTVSRVNYVLVNSSPVEEALHALKQASRISGVKTILDYSAKEDADIGKASELIRYADYVLAPDDARVPGMARSNWRELMTRLTKDYGRKHVAISNSNENVSIYDNGKYTSFPIPRVEVQSATGAGDTRDAAFPVALAAGYDFTKSVEISSLVATHYVQQPSREAFFASLPQFAKELRKIPAYQQTQAEYHETAMIPHVNLGTSWGDAAPAPA